MQGKKKGKKGKKCLLWLMIIADRIAGVNAEPSASVK